jgi:hypothetical protein
MTFRTSWLVGCVFLVLANVGPGQPANKQPAAKQPAPEYFMGNVDPLAKLLENAK